MIRETDVLELHSVTFWRVNRKRRHPPGPLLLWTTGIWYFTQQIKTKYIITWRERMMFRDCIYDIFHWKCYTSKIHQIEKHKFFGINSNLTKISIWVCSTRYWGISVSRFGGSRAFSIVSRNCQETPGPPLHPTLSVGYFTLQITKKHTVRNPRVLGIPANQLSIKTFTHMSPSLRTADFFTTSKQNKSRLEEGAA